MLEDIAASRFGFWIVALLMAGFDSAFLLKPGSYAFSISSTNLVRFRVSLNPFTMRSKELVSSLLSFPFQLFFVSDIDAPDRTARELFKAMSRMRRLSRQVTVFSVLAILATILLILGPCLAAMVSNHFSIFILFPPLYAFALITSVLLWRRRRRFGFSKGTVLKISAEITLCPVLLVNISKRISLAQMSSLNAVRLASFSDAPKQTLLAIRENIRYHTGE